MKNKYTNKLKLLAALVVFVASFPFLTTGVVRADRAQDFCDELFPVISGSDIAAQKAACVTSARAAETRCGTNGVGNDLWQQCIDNYYAGVTGTSSGSSSGSNSSQPIDDRPIEADCEPDPPGTPLNRENCGIINLIVIGINFLSALAGIVLVASLMIAGFTYMTAQDDPGKVQKSKTRIIQTLIALALFIFMYSLLNFLVPGGVLP